MADKVTPITPGEITQHKANSIPDVVIEVFNELIVKHWNGHSSNFIQDEAVGIIEDRGIPRNELFENNWLDVEDTFRLVGWKVVYDKPGFNESYNANFTFTRS